MCSDKYASKPTKLVHPIPPRDFKVKYLPKNVHPPMKPIKRPPWNPDVKVRHTASTRFEAIRHITKYEVDVPSPDYLVMPAKRYTFKGDQPVDDGDVWLLRKNYKIAPWCDPVRRTRERKHIYEKIQGKEKEWDEDLPSRYQQMYLGEGAKMNSVRMVESNKCPIYVPIDTEAENDEKIKRVFCENVKAESSTNKGHTYKDTGLCAYLPHRRITLKTDVKI